MENHTIKPPNNENKYELLCTFVLISGDLDN